MAAPLSDGSSGADPGSATGLEQEVSPGAWSSPPRRSSDDRGLPLPLLWFPVGLSSLLLVLFVVVVNRQQAQAQRIEELLTRVQGLENSRALERTAVLEQQLRAMLTRLSSLEQLDRQQEPLGRQMQSLQQEIQQLRQAARPALSPLDLESPVERLPRTPRPMPAVPARQP